MIDCVAQQLVGLTIWEPDDFQEIVSSLLFLMKTYLIKLSYEIDEEFKFSTV